MTKTTTIPVKPDTKQSYDALRDGRKHDHFIQQLIAIYRRLTPVERAQILERQTQPTN